MSPNPNDTRSPEEVLKAQRMMILVFSVATLIPALWMLLMASSGITGSQGEDAVEGMSTVLVFWGMAAPPVWLVSTFIALKKINDGNAEGAKYFPLIPAFWAIIWFAAQVTG